MHLILYGLGKVATFGAKLVALLVSLFVGLVILQAVVPEIREAMADRDRLRQASEERSALETELEQLEGSAAAGQGAAVDSLTDAIEAEVADGRTAVSDKKDDLDKVREEQDLCGWGREVAAWIAPGNFCDDAEAVVAAADNALATAEANLAKAEDEAAILVDPTLDDGEKLDQLGADSGQSIVDREIDNTQAELAQKQAEEAGLTSRQDSWAGVIVDTWASTWRWLAFVAFVFLVLPAIGRLVSYFALMPLLTRMHNPVQLSGDDASDEARLSTELAERTLTISLTSGEVLAARGEYIRPVGGKVRTIALYDMGSPFISFASGLRGLTRVTGDDGPTLAKLTDPDDPDTYLMRIDFADHPGVVMHPKHVVGIIGAPELRTRWNWRIQAFATWQVRYILFAGTGSLLVRGSGDVQAVSPAGGSARMNQNLVMGFDSRLVAGISRTEVFVPYFRGRAPLVNDEFTGDDRYFWQKSTSNGTSNPVTRTFNAFFSALGKVLGF